MSRAVPAVLCLAAGVNGACASDPALSTSGAKGTPAQKRPETYEAAELLPADLDLVLRVDLARMKASLGPDAVKDLSARAFDEAAKAAEDNRLLAEAIEHADLVWVGLRLADWEAGDRIVVVEGKSTSSPDRSLDYRRLPSGMEGIDIWDRAESAPRSGIERIVRIHPRISVFSSPVEVDSLMRVLTEGPDARHGDPQAVGLISLDVRPSGFSAPLQKTYPSITSLLEGVKRVRARLEPAPGGLLLKAMIEAKNKAAATRVFRFLAVFRDNVSSEAGAALFRGLELEPLESTLSIRWTLPAAQVAAWLSGAEPRDTPE